MNEWMKYFIWVTRKMPGLIRPMSHWKWVQNNGKYTGYRFKSWVLVLYMLYKCFPIILQWLFPRLGVADPCRLANLLYSRELIGKDIQKEAQTSQSIHCFKILTLDPCATVVLDISNTKYYPYTLSWILAKSITEYMENIFINDLKLKLRVKIYSWLSIYCNTY